MTRLYDYIEDYTPLLIEKVNKAEINEMLTNTDIYVGAEFEFIINDVGPEMDLDHLFDLAKKDWNDYRYDWTEWRKEKEKYDENYKPIKDQIERWEESVKEKEFELEKLKLQGYKEDKKYAKDLEQEISNLESSIKKYNKRLNDMDRKEPEPPEMGHNYYDYMEKLGYSQYDDLDIDPYYHDEDGPVYPYDPDSADIQGEWDEYAMENWIKEVQPRPPFRDWQINSGQRMGDTHWDIKEDSSLSYGGTEITSPPMSMKDFVKKCPEMFDWIDEIGHTDSSCGFHIHMSLKGTPDLDKALDLSKLIMFTDEEYIYRYFDEREGSTYVKSVKQVMAGNARLIDKKKLEIERGVMSQHFNSINWQGISDRHGHIEFRYLGGTNYSRKWDKIKVIIAQYAYNLNLATNPKFKWKEYQSKLARLMNKMEKSRIANFLIILNDIQGEAARLSLDNPKSTKYIKSEITKIGKGSVSGVDWFDPSSKIKYLNKILDTWKSFMKNNYTAKAELKDKFKKYIQYLT